MNSMKSILRQCLACLVTACSAVVFVGGLVAAEPLLKPNDCLALVGGTLVERPAFATLLNM